MFCWWQQGSFSDFHYIAGEVLVCECNKEGGLLFIVYGKASVSHKKSWGKKKWLTPHSNVCVIGLVTRDLYGNGLDWNRGEVLKIHFYYWSLFFIYMFKDFCLEKTNCYAWWPYFLARLQRWPTLLQCILMYSCKRKKRRKNNKYYLKMKWNPTWLLVERKIFFKRKEFWWESSGFFFSFTVCVQLRVEKKNHNSFAGAVNS